MKSFMQIGLAALLFAAFVGIAHAQYLPVVPPEKRGRLDAERSGTHGAANIRTVFWNYGMVGDYPRDPLNVDLSVFHSVEVPKGTGMNYSDGITPFVLAKVRQRNGFDAYIMETGYRERQARSPYYARDMRFEPRPGFFQADPSINEARSPALSNDPRTWPDFWPDKENDPDDPGWRNSWDGYFGKRPAADQESYTVMDDDFYDGFDYFPDFRDSTRHGLGLRIDVRGFQWSNPQSGNVIFWHYDIANEATTDYNDNIIFGLYMDSGVGGSAISCDGVAESDDDNAFFDKSSGLNLVYTWDKFGHGRDLTSNCGRTGYLGYAYLETPGNAFNGFDDDDDGITDEVRDGGPGSLIVGQDAIRAYAASHYNLAKFDAYYGNIETRSAYRAGRWWTGDENLSWVAELHDYGGDGVPGTNDTGEGDGMPTAGEPNFDRTDLFESDQIGLTGFKMNRIVAGAGNTSTETDDIIFFNDGKKNWPTQLYNKFTNPNSSSRFDSALVLNYNIGFLFASGPFKLKAGKIERFSLALSFGSDLQELRSTVKTVQRIYNANYQFAVPPPLPTVKVDVGDGYVRLSWDDLAERGIDPVTLENDFEGYRIYRSTDADFLDTKTISNGRGTGPLGGNGTPIAQFDLKDERRGYSPQVVEGVAYWLGEDNGVTHTWTDTTVVNGQEYYYAVCAYDFGSEVFGYYPSENSISVFRNPRGGTILGKNIVLVRPNPKALGYETATASNTDRISGSGTGWTQVRVVDPAQVPEDHVFHIVFGVYSPDSIRAGYYDLIDSTTGKKIFSNGYDLDGEGIGQVGSGLLPVTWTITTPQIDSARTGFQSGSATNLKLKNAYQYVLPINLKRPGYPDDLVFTFSDTPIETSLVAIGTPARPTKFRVTAKTDSGDLRIRFRFRDLDANGTLNRAGEYVDIVTYTAAAPTFANPTWRVEVDTAGMAGIPITVPTVGDVYQLGLLRPFTAGDVFRFTTKAESRDGEKARQQFTDQSPYVVPNPYVGAAAFEPQRFANSGRGERRIEFRGLPARCTIRIFTARGELVQTITHEDPNTGFVAWDLRSKDNLEIAPGLYIFHVDGAETGTSIGKFAVIK